MNPCFICHRPANAIRSITMLTAPPPDSRDAVAICPQCAESLDFALIQILTLDLASETQPSKTLNLNFNRNSSHHQL
jgi:hypothetical protein